MASMIQLSPTLPTFCRSELVQRSVSSRRTVRCSTAEGPLRRPRAPTSEATTPSTLPLTQTPPLQGPPSTSSSPPPPPTASAPTFKGVTIEYQRQRAKELQEYFIDRKYEEQSQKGRIFGWTRKNEISNGRWAMFGIAVGLLTEFATGSDFVDQIKIIFSNLGIVDLD